MRVKNLIDWKKIEDLFVFTRQTWSKWKKEDRPVVSLIEKYFTDKDINEFLDSGKISRFENIKFMTDNFILKNQSFYLKSFELSDSLLHQTSTRNEFKDFYFSFLAEMEKKYFKLNIEIFGLQSVLTNFLYQFQIKKLKKYNYIHANDNIEKDKFDENEREFDSIMCHYFTFNSWNNDIYFFLKLLKEGDFDYFINSNNNELFYQSIGYLIYSSELSKNLEMINKLELVYLTFNYFKFNKDLISTINVKEHILRRIKEPEYFKEKDDEIEKLILNEPISITTIEDNLIEEYKEATWDELTEEQKN